MRRWFGLHLPSYTFPDTPPERIFDRLLEQTRAAEDAGFELITVMDHLYQIQGVGQVNVGGASYPSVRVDVNPPQLNHYGITMATIQRLLSLQNSDLARGQIADGLERVRPQPLLLRAKPLGDVFHDHFHRRHHFARAAHDA